MTTTTASEGIKVKVISDGSWQLDGGAVFGGIAKREWEKFHKPDRLNRVRLGLNCLLITTPEHKILVNTGIGTKQQESVRDEYGHKTSKLLSQLRREGVKPKDIDYVVLTQLQFDHAGGATRMTTDGTITPTFPKARHIVQKRAWEESRNLTPRNAPSYEPCIEHLQVLVDHDLIDFVDGDTQVVPGVEMQVTDGHSDGHCIVKVNSGSERYVYLADLVPTPLHLNLPCITTYDRYPEQTFELKQRVLEEARQKGLMLVFANGYEHVTGYITNRGLEPINLS